jgi:CelD/BcsL family acetyltransferase involved in cellulose biosynthesis
VTLVPAWLQVPAGSSEVAFPATSELVHGFDRLRALAAEIDALARSCAAPATARPAWVLASLRLEPDRDPWAVLVRDPGGVLVACAILADSTGHGADLVRIAGSGSGHRGALIAASRPAAERLARAMAEALVTRTRSFQLSLGPVDATCEVVAALTQVLPGAVAAPVDPIPVVRRGESRSAADYLTPGVQRTLRKAANRLAKDGHALSVVFTRDRGRITRTLPVLEECHRARDHARGRDSDLDDGAARLLWHARLRALADDGSLELATAQVDGHLAAYVLGILDRPAYRVLEGHLVTRWARYAPGRVLEAAVLQRMLDDDTFDTFDWMTSVAPESLLATNDHEAVVVVRTG